MIRLDVETFRIGSSPRVRGTDFLVKSLGAVLRFIPACAGNSGKNRSGCQLMTVHPRVCGEQAWRGQIDAIVGGSSPRVRGTVRPGGHGRLPRRFIPACAGNRTAQCRPLMSTTVHPRVCGEQRLPAWWNPVAFGSSPRVRGTGNNLLGDGRRVRFIPACAGNRSLVVSQIRLTSVHPRVCGEQVGGDCGCRCCCGSSPRVRGTVRKFGSKRTVRRFIPACAGNSPRQSSAPGLPTVHPRVCGEQVLIGIQR